MDPDPRDTVRSVGLRKLVPYDATELNASDHVEDYLTELLLSTGTARSKFLSISNHVLSALEKASNKQDSPVYGPSYSNGPVEIAVTRLSISGIETRIDEASPSQNITQCNLYDYESIRFSVTPAATANVFDNLFLLIVTTIICTALLVWFLMRYVSPRRSETTSSSTRSEESPNTIRGSYTSEASTSSSVGRFPGPSISDDGQLCIGKISFDPKNVLGNGCQGTFVFKGNFENSQTCAVKRVLSEYLRLADREIDFLRSLQHPNLVRYFAREEDVQFVYIAIEMAEFTLADLIDKRLNNTHEDSLQITNLELWHQSALGLKYLHDLDIIHRDIKPQNILISFPLKPDNKRKVMISDFGMSKRISNTESCYTSNIGRYLDGTHGWIAAEIMNARLSDSTLDLRPSKSIDIFALGCVFYYIHSGGMHPFGESLDRQSNIIKGINKLYTEKQTVTIDGRPRGGGPSKEEADILITYLISTMISHEADQRPPIDAVLSYPLFWSRSRQLQFLQDVSDRIEKLENTSEIVSRIETGRIDVVQLDWQSQLGIELQNDLRKFRTYKKYSVRDLLRAIRNKKNHYRELSTELQQSLGDIPDEYTDYFTRRFPRLLPHVYLASQTLRNETVFQMYYHRSNGEAYRWPELPRSAARVIL